MIIEFQGDSSIEIAHLGTRDEIAMQIRIDALMLRGRLIFEAMAAAFRHVSQVLDELSMKLMENSGRIKAKVWFADYR